jgi:hypothetical protein
MPRQLLKDGRWFYYYCMKFSDKSYDVVNEHEQNVCMVKMFAGWSKLLEKKK